MHDVLSLPDSRVREATAATLAPGLSDRERVEALAPLQGFGSGGAFTSVLLTAWDPSEFGVFDDRVTISREQVVVPGCACNWDELPVYWDHLRRIAAEMPGADVRGHPGWWNGDLHKL